METVLNHALNYGRKLKDYYPNFVQKIIAFLVNNVCFFANQEKGRIKQLATYQSYFG